MKITLADKIQIYNEWKMEHKSPERIAKERSLSYGNIGYMIRLADRHGVEALEHKWTYYDPEFKESAIKRVLLGGEAALQVSLDLGLSNHGLLANWIREYKANGYNVVERKRGRHAKEEDSRRAAGRNSRIIKAERRASPEESAAYDRKRIQKKIESLGFGEKSKLKE